MKGLAVLGGAVLVIVASIWSGYVLSILWGWFVSGYFGIKPLTIPVAIGITMVARYLASDLTQRKDASTVDFTSSIIAELVAPAITLVFGYIVHLFM